MSKDKVFVNVQALRGFAAVIILLGHALLPSDFPLVEGLLKSFHWWAYAGVDIFFVLSGFIISSAASRMAPAATHAGRLRESLQFFARRCLRVYPVYWLVLLLSIVAAHWFTFAPPGWPQESWTSLVLLATPLNRYIPQAWTLGFEMLFYAVFALVLWLAPTRHFFVLMGLMLLQAVIVATVQNPDSAMLSSALILEFGMGCIVARLLRLPLRLHPLGLLAAGLICFAIGAWLTAMSVSLHARQLGSVARMLSFGVGAALLLASAVRAELQGSFVAARWLHRLGDASYSIYLLHKLVLVVLIDSYSASTLALRVPKAPAVLLAVAITLAICVAFYRYVEQPLLRVLRARWL